MLEGFGLSRSLLFLKCTVAGFKGLKRFPSRRFGKGPNPIRIAEAPPKQQSTFLVEIGSTQNSRTSDKEAKDLHFFCVFCAILQVADSISSFSVMPTIPQKFIFVDFFLEFPDLLT